VTTGLGVDDVHGLQKDMDRRVDVSREPILQIVHRHPEHAPQGVEVSDDLCGSAQYFAAGHATTC
jgi:hypothetical protein